MKKILTVLLLLTGFTTAVNAQCTPDPSYTVPGIYPDSATGIPHATVGLPYSTVIQFRIPTDTVYAGAPVTIDFFRITSVTGLPSGFAWSSTPSNGSFPGGSNGCMQIDGTAPTTPMIGSYPLVVGIRVVGRLYGIIPDSIDTQNDNYILVIDANTGTGTIVPSIFDVSQNQPNPFSGTSEITVTMPVSETVSIRITDLLGNLVKSQSTFLQRGVSKLNLSSAEFSPGIYLYTVSNGRNSFTRRMIVSGN